MNVSSDTLSASTYARLTRRNRRTDAVPLLLRSCLEHGYRLRFIEQIH